MRNPYSLELIIRFWAAFDALRRKNGRGFLKEFVTEADTNNGNFLRLRNDPYREFEPYYFKLICDYGVNPHWLITGRGEMFLK